MTPALDAAEGHMCNCVGPQPGQPKCPCQMRHLIQRDGRWIQPEVDMGPVALTQADMEFAASYDFRKAMGLE